MIRSLVLTVVLVACSSDRDPPSAKTQPCAQCSQEVELLRTYATQLVNLEKPANAAAAFLPEGPWAGPLPVAPGVVIGPLDVSFAGRQLTTVDSWHPRKGKLVDDALAELRAKTAGAGF